MRLVLALCLFAVQAFQTPRSRPAAQIQRRAFLDDDDGSIWDTLLRNGPISFGIRVARPDFYEETVVTFGAVWKSTSELGYPEIWHGPS